MSEGEIGKGKRSERGKGNEREVKKIEREER